MQLMKEHPLPEYKRPKYPDYHTNDGLGLPATKSTTSGPGGQR